MSNQLTQKAKLNVNINTFCAYIKEYFKSNEMLVKYEEKETKEMKTKPPQMAGSQVAFAAAVEKLITLLLTAGSARTVEDASGMRTLRRGDLRDAVLDSNLNADMSQYFCWKIRSFNQKQMYRGTLPVSKKELDKLIDTTCENFVLTVKSRNLLIYLVSEFFVDMVNTSYQFMIHAGKKSVRDNDVVAAIKCHTSGNMCQDLVKEVVRATKAVGKVISDDPEDNEDGDGVNDDADEADSDIEQDEDEVVQVKSKGKGKKAPATKTAKGKKVTKIEESEAEESGADDAGTDDDAAESDAEEVVVAKSKAKSKSKAKGAARRSK